MDSDVRAREGNMSLDELPIVGGTIESETGVVSLGSEFTRDGRTSSRIKCIKCVVCVKWK